MPAPPTWDETEAIPSWDETEPVESTPLDDRPPRGEMLEPEIPRPSIGATGTWEDESGIPPEIGFEQTRQLQVASEMAAARVEGEPLQRAARFFERNLPGNLIAPTTEEFLSEGEKFRATTPAEMRPWQQSPFRPPTTAAELSPETRESLAAGQAASGTLADLSSADQLMVLGGAAATGGAPGAAGRILGAAVPATFGVEGLKSIYEGAKTLLSDDATPEQRGEAKFQIGMGATMLPGFGGLVKRPVIAERVLAKTEAAVPGALPKAKAALEQTVTKEQPKPEVKSAIQEPPAAESLLRQERPDVELQEVRQPQAEIADAIPREPARGQGGEESQVLLRETGTDAIKRVEALPDAEAVKLDQKAKSYEGTTFTPGDVPALIAARDASGTKLGELFEAAAKPDASAEALRAAQAEYGRNVWLSGAIEIANKKGPNYAAMVEDQARAAKGATTPTAANQTSIPARQAPVVESRVGAVPKDVSGAGAALKKGDKVITDDYGAGEVTAVLPNRVVVKFAEGDGKPFGVAASKVRKVEATAAAQPELPGTFTAKSKAIRIKYRVPATGATKRFIKTEGGWYREVSGKPSGRPIDPTIGLVAALEKQAAADIARREWQPAQPLPEPAGPKAGGEQPTPAASQAVAAQSAEVGPGMGGALKAEPPDTRAQLAQLTDSIATLAARGKTRPTEAFSLGETLSKAKDSATAALDGLKAAGSYMKLKLEGKPTATEYKGVLGDRHLALSESSVNARKWVQSVKKAVPDPKVREAISNWVDSGGDSALLTKAAGETKPQYKAGYERAQKLTPEEKVVAENLRNYFDSRLQEAIDAGVLEDGIENYIHRIYEQDSPWKKGVIQELRSGLFTGQPALAKQRVFEYDFEAEKAGKKPIKDFAKRVVAYDLALNKAIADRAAVKGMMEIKMSDGRPMIDVGGGGKVIENAAGEPQATIINRSAKKIDPNDAKANRGDYKPFDHPALRKWKWATEDTAGKPVFVQGDVLIHPEAIGDINKLLGRSAIRQNPIGRTALNVSSTIKQTMLDLSGFHPVQIAVHGTEHRTFAPVKEIDFTNPDVRGLIRGGAAVGETSGHAAFSEGLSGGSGSLTKHIPWVGERLQAYNSWLFEDYIPRLKVAMGLHALERNRSRFKDLSPDQQYELTANQMNAAFGEQNYTMLGRSKTTQDALRLALLAPDFLEARSRFVAQAFTKYGAEQRQALLLGAVTMYITARLINKMLDDEYHFEPKNAFNVVYGGKSYGLRTVQGDLIHAVTEPGKFINHRLNPVFGKPALEFVTGRDYFGRKRTVTEQLEDFAKTPVPIGVRGAFENQEQTLFESFLNSFGLVTKRDSASSDMSQLAQKWKEKNKISTGPGEFVYDADKDPFRDIKLAAERGDEAGVRSEVAKAMNAGMKRSRILEHFKLSAMHHFAGSAANEKKFIGSLTEDQKKIYRDAVAERKRIRETVRRAGFTP